MVLVDLFLGKDYRKVVLFDVIWVLLGQVLDQSHPLRVRCVAAGAFVKRPFSIEDVF